MIPISIVTGFLGSGKTTLIARLLRDPIWARTAVIVNEWGEIGLDHTLIASSDESLVTLTTGCLCCQLRSDIATTLLGLARGGVAYDRVLVETSGLADPAPILQALITDPDIAATHTLDTVLTLLDTQHGAATLARHAEARRQVALADRLLLTKTDLGPAPHDLLARVAALNPHAPVLEAARGAIAPAALFAGADPAARAARLATLPVAAATPFARRHAPATGSVVLQRAQPIAALALAHWLHALVEHCGPRLLRLKGLVNVAEMPGGPAVIHVVGHSIATPEWLDAQSTPETRIVIIGEGIPPHFPARLLAAIEQEVGAGSG